MTLTLTLTPDRGAALFVTPSRVLTFSCPCSERWTLVGTIVGPEGAVVAGDRLTLPGVSGSFSADGAYLAAKYGAFGLALRKVDKAARAKKGGGR